ncbi:MAG: Fe-S-containing hydro-lyase [Eubacteriales bacterium]|jgi:fumarate hydratase subunit beta|nr:Fe-S-containing hydro-lyase [Eubacteriales bacterium]MDD3074852.1 Fe-S-containing hydro-lyase [Eubacteriales bacterium]MDD4078422.1 Fe-S-containing hydro-lyase [Eubacteriales bacterium]MDD4768315.1 Fe-S-containing hydro-lyase [Eubacteriales bacterium]HBI56126.1 Fe-S-containing hydro-lyase [Bacillota bacterium]
MEPIKLQTPLTVEDTARLRAGQTCLLSGIIYTARDSAHKRLVEMLEKGEKLPFDPQGQLIYYVGPCPAPPGRVIGSAGPTTSTRMDIYTPAMLAAGVRGVIGKGDRSQEVVQALMQHKAVYFGAIGGAGALIAKSIVQAEVVAFPDLGPEAVHRLQVKEMPVVVVIDSLGQNFYTLGRAEYSKR